MPVVTIAIHGGAGTLLRSEISESQEEAYRAALQRALDTGYHSLTSTNNALGAVIAAVAALEDDILFNAGRGSVYTIDGRQEMDASLMEGKDRLAGAVCGVRNIRNPIRLAHAVMTKSDHVLLSGAGANDFAASIGMPIEPDEYFHSDFRKKQWELLQGTGRVALDHGVAVKGTADPIPGGSTGATYPGQHLNDSVLKDKKFGTVGAVACDAQGNIAAATSTGGMTNKQFGRVGDSPLIGAGTYANNQTCAISCTGHGELFIRSIAAYDVSCLMEYRGLSLQQAMDIVVNDKLVKIQGEGGMIGVDPHGNYSMLFNSEGMYRGVRNSQGVNEVLIYR